MKLGEGITKRTRLYTVNVGANNYILINNRVWIGRTESSVQKVKGPTHVQFGLSVWLEQAELNVCAQKPVKLSVCHEGFRALPANFSSNRLEPPAVQDEPSVCGETHLFLKYSGVFVILARNVQAGTKYI